ncbi:MAG: S41 family peptidase [Pseudomonadota bacterium]
MDMEGTFVKGTVCLKDLSECGWADRLVFYADDAGEIVGVNLLEAGGDDPLEQVALNGNQAVARTRRRRRRGPLPVGSAVIVEVTPEHSIRTDRECWVTVTLKQSPENGQELETLNSQRVQAELDVPLMTPGHGLGAVTRIDDFRRSIDENPFLTVGERRLLVEQALILVRDLYTHLPLKRAMHAIDPVQRLTLLKAGLTNMSVNQFTGELLTIFKELRDLHTNLRLPAPFGRQVAFLGILVEQYFAGDEERYLVSKVADHLVRDANLVPGAQITHWNGMPIQSAVARNADKEAGSNMPARIARGLESLTLRDMDSSLPPDEDWVDLTYLVDGTTHQSRLPWKVFEEFADIVEGSDDPTGLIEDLSMPLRYNIGADARQEMHRRVKKKLFNRPAVAEAERAYAAARGVTVPVAAAPRANVLESDRPDEVSARIVNVDGVDFGYLRLWTFFMRDFNIDAFLVEVIKLLEDDRMPENGLIIDVRGNGGGFVIAAEFLLQFLTPRTIQPEPSQFIATEATLDLVNTIESMAPWEPSLKQAVQTGALYSAGIPLSDPEVVNLVGQIYFGPVVLLTDAFCYSACDMFAAGFQDHEIGEIIGVDELTGAGGANVLTHSGLRDDWTGGPLRPLPGGADMRVSLRRTLRVGTRSGEPIEDLGVRADIRHKMTRNDLLNGNEDLLKRSAHSLKSGGKKPRSLNVDFGASGQDLLIHVNAIGMQEVDLYLDDRPLSRSALDLNGRTQVVTALPPVGTRLQVVGYDAGVVVGRRKIFIQEGQ